MGGNLGPFEYENSFTTNKKLEVYPLTILTVPNSIVKRATIITNKNVNKTCHYNKYQKYKRKTKFPYIPSMEHSSHNGC
jgi:hypothetical protein